MGAAIDISTLTSSELDELIATAAKLRAALQPPVPMDVDNEFDSLVVTVAWDPRFLVNEAPMDGGAILRIRDPGRGWLAYYMPHGSALKLSELLKQWSRDPVTSPATRQ